MTDALFHIRIADWHTDQAALRRIRETVFIIEQSVPKALEWDGEDESATHAIAEDSNGNIIGTGRLLKTGQIGRMAVAPEWRNRGVGAAILSKLLEAATLGNYPPLFLNAQIHAKDFYARHGFRPVGELFQEAEIDHVRMELSDGHS